MYRILKNELLQFFPEKKDNPNSSWTTIKDTNGMDYVNTEEHAMELISDHITNEELERKRKSKVTVFEYDTEEQQKGLK